MDARVFMIELPAFFATGTTALLTAGMAVAMAVIDPSVEKITTAAIGAAATITLSFIAYRTLVLSKKLDAQKTVSEETLEKTAVILGHVNSRETKYLGDIAALEQEVRILRETLSEKKETAVLLAQAAAQGKKPDKESGR